MIIFYPIKNAVMSDEFKENTLTDYGLRIMKILHILKTEPEDSIKKIIEEQKKDHDIDVVSLTECKDYRSIMNLIENADKVMVW